MIYNQLAPKKTGKKSFREEDFPVQAIAELIIGNMINNVCSKVMAVKDVTEACSPDLRIIDRCSGKLLAYAEVQTSTNFIGENEYRYKDFLWYERRNNKNYGGLPVAFIYYDLNWGSYLFATLRTINKALETCPHTIADRYSKGGDIIQNNEKTFHLPLSVFSKNKGIEKLDNLKKD